ncbi:hypothetical protein Sjap_007089 [Stephania japonica]|uniref:Uncharacterized protein n=1 Tax=Stephania japonica TaxID=461633 RepID=A0AAP0K758_9MAGN
MTTVISYRGGGGGSDDGKEEAGDKKFVSIILEDVNPIELGHRSRQIFNEVWRKFSGLGQISRTTHPSDDDTVLIGEALVRKADKEVLDMLPRSVQVVVGDVGDPSTLKSTVEGYNKIIYCATARSTITGDLLIVDHQGVYNEVRQGTYVQDVIAAKYDGGMDAKFEFTETGNVVFSGYVFTRGEYGLVLSVGGNGRSFILILEVGPLADTTKRKLYFTRMSTKVGFCRVRIPFSSFHPVNPDDPPIDPFLVHTLTIRFEPIRQVNAIALMFSQPDYAPPHCLHLQLGFPAQSMLKCFQSPVQSDLKCSQSHFPAQLTLLMFFANEIVRRRKWGDEYDDCEGSWSIGEREETVIGQETDFVLVSCAGLGIEPSRREQVIKAKKGRIFLDVQVLVTPLFVQVLYGYSFTCPLRCVTT